MNCSWLDWGFLLHSVLIIGIVADMAKLLTILIVKAVAAIYGLLALAVAILYSLSRSDTRRRSTEEERRAFDKGKEDLCK